MNLTDAQKKRLVYLRNLPAKDITPELAKELETLNDLATKAGITVDAAFEAANAPDEDSKQPAVLTAEQAQATIESAVKEAFKGLTLDIKGLVTQVEAAGGATVTKLFDALKVNADGAKQLQDAAAETSRKTAEALTSQNTAISASVAVLTQSVDALKAWAANMQAGGRSDGNLNAFHVEVPTNNGRKHNLPLARAQLLNVMCDRPLNHGVRESDLAAAAAAGEKALSNYAVVGAKALTVGGSGSGAELVPTDLSSELMMRLYLESSLVALFARQEFQMPADTFKFPLTTTRPAFYVGSENPGSDATESSPGTSSLTLDAAKLIGRTDYSYEAEEDSLIALLPMITAQLSEAAAAAYESAIISGDTTATHQDSDYHGVTAHHAKLFKGLRKYALAGSCSTSLASGGISAANLNAMFKSMGKWASRAKDCAIIVGSKGYRDILGLTETLTVDKLGPQASILTGMVGALYGVPIFVSEQMRENTNASGVYDGTTTTKGTILIVHVPSYVAGVRRGFTVETDVNRKQQTKSVIASFRRDFKPKETPSTSIPSVWIGYNYNS